MFRLLKLAIYAMIGYAIYEFVQGIREPMHGASEGYSGGGRLGGPGEGMDVETEDVSGARSSRTVGRGVVR